MADLTVVAFVLINVFTQGLKNSLIILMPINYQKEGRDHHFKSKHGTVCCQEMNIRTFTVGVKITHFCTDRSLTVKAMFEDLNKWMNISIIHKYDVWHMVKSIMKYSQTC